MGVDATLFVIADYSRDVAYSEAMIELDRDRALFRLLESLPVAERRKCLQLPHASFTCYQNGERVSEDCETGYRFGDSYGPASGFRVYTIASIATIIAQADEHNRKVLDFLLSAYPSHSFLIYWH